MDGGGACPGAAGSAAGAAGAVGVGGGAVGAGAGTLPSRRRSRAMERAPLSPSLPAFAPARVD